MLTDERRYCSRIVRDGAAKAFTILAILATLMVLTPDRAGATEAGQEITDAATGIRLRLPEELIGRESRTRWGTNWRSVDRSIEVDSLGYPEDQDFKRLFTTMKALRGRVLTTEQVTEAAFTLSGLDPDGSRFHVEMRREGRRIRGFSLVVSSRVQDRILTLAPLLRDSFVPFPGALAPAATVSNVGAPASPTVGITVMPNLGSIGVDDGIEFAPNGKYIAIGSRTQIKLWDLASGRPLRLLEHTAYFQHFSFIEGGRQILSVHRDGRIRLWDPATGLLTREVLIPESENDLVVTGLSHHPSSSSVVIVAHNDAIAVWNYAKGSFSRPLKFGSSSYEERVSAGALSRDGRTLHAVGGRLVKRFDGDRTTAAATTRVRGAFDPISNGLLSSGHIIGRTAATDCEADVVLVTPDGSGLTETILDRAPGCPTTGEPDHTHAAIRVAWNEAAGVIAVGRKGGTTSKLVRLGTTGVPPATVPGPIVAFDPTGTMAAVEADTGLRIVRLADSAVISTLKGQGYDGFTFPIVSGDGRQMMLLHTRPNVAETTVWPIEGVVPLHGKVQLPTGFEVRHAMPGPNILLADNENGNFAVYSTITGERLSAFTLTGLEDFHIARVSPDGQHAMIGNALVDIRQGRIVLRPGVRSGGTDIAWTSYGFSSDGTRLALGGHGGAEVWTVKPPRRLSTLRMSDQEEQLTSVTFSPDQRRLIGGSRDSEIFVWDLQTGKQAQTLTRDLLAGHVSTGGVGMSHDSRVVAAGPLQRAVSSGDIGRERRVQVWDVTTAKLTALLSGHEANVNAIVFTPDGRWLVSGSNDGTIRYWERATGRLRATFASASEGRWAIVTDRGFFAASANAGDLLSVVKGFDALSIEQMWQSLYAPDLVRELLLGDLGGEVKLASETVNLEAVINSGPAPKVEILPLATGSTSKRDLIEVETRITDQGTGIGRIEWRVNGVTAAVHSGADGSRGSPTQIVKRQIALDPGPNTVEVVAYNANNLLASLPVRMSVKLDQTKDQTRPKLFVLAIGIDSYRDRGPHQPTFPPLRLAARDAGYVAVALQNAGRSTYGEVKVTALFNGDATAAGIEAAIARLETEIHPRDTLIVFVAGHGYSNASGFYLVPVDHDGGTSQSALDRSAIGQAKLQVWLANRIKAKKVLLLLDTCESGALVSRHSRSLTEGPATERAVGRLHEATGRPVLTAAADGKPAFEGYQEHGVFTWAVLDALRNGDRNNSGSIELSELVAHVQDQVPRIAALLNGRGRAAARGTGGQQQSARFGSRGEDFSLVGRLP